MEYIGYYSDWKENIMIKLIVEKLKDLLMSRLFWLSIVYSVLAIVFIFLGTVAENDLVWELTDVFNNLMVIPNVIALAALSGIVVKATKSAKKK